MVNCIRLNSVLRATCRALSTTAGKKQRPLAAETADQHHVTRNNFSDVQSVRHEQARHSVLIGCPARINENKFLKYLSQYGEVASHFFFDSNCTHAVVEFVDLQSVESLLSGTKIPNDEDLFVVPYKSRFIRVKTTEVGQQFPKCWPQSSIPMNNLFQKLCAAENIEDQAQMLLDELQLTEESIRIRYLVSSLISDIATAYFPEATVHLYGSSVNSFGKMGCDLDLFLNLEDIKGYKTGKTPSSYSAEFWMRRVSSGRTAQQKILSVIGECIDSFGPGCNEVQKILNARCPLVRFSHQSSGLQCDLTADNKIALRSSELLYIYGNLDHRVRALVFALRCWARVHGITSCIPGQWITNFSLTMMVLFFLQKRNPPVIPTLDHLKSLAGKKEKMIIDGNDCTFVGDINKIKQSASTESLDTLLVEFLEFYGKFDFRTNCIDIRKGIEKNKPEAAALYIQNPFEQTLNISKNVNQSQLQKFVNIAQESAFILQDQARRSSKNEKPWGLASILQTTSADKGATTKRKKKVSASERIGSLLDSLTDSGNTGKTEAEH
ncbi:poly(A) RNA polymerase, mitochondrial [Bufo bufo]|uniref:poly(A) RNA polymerase, mitochondrial n=1 Tax=Bufo bufo TaxID=8384 RepID=UPI001ABE7F94|nr:poly(A) RNA polymerase, mitochondrial [Bufo bufo]